MGHLEWMFFTGICELNDNILPTQPENMVLPSTDTTYQEILDCLHKHHGHPQTRDDICEEVFGDAYSPDDDDAEALDEEPVDQPGEENGAEGEAPEEESRDDEVAIGR